MKYWTNKLETLLMMKSSKDVFNNFSKLWFKKGHDWTFHEYVNHTNNYKIEEFSH